MADIGEVCKCIKLEPEVFGIKEEPTNDCTKEFQELPVKIKEEPEVNFPYDGGSCWSPTGIKEEWIDDVTVEELDVDSGSVGPLGSCNETEKTSKGESVKVLSQLLEKKKPYMCFVCSSAFCHKYNLKYHMRTHTGENPHVCDICGLGFSRSDCVKKHMRIHSGERPYVCDICGSGFRQNSNLNQHMRTHTGARPHVCDICGSGFSENGNLKKHMRTHTGERPYVCDICGKGFCLSGNLKRHMGTHTKTL